MDYQLIKKIEINSDGMFDPIYYIITVEDGTQYKFYSKPSMTQEEWDEAMSFVDE